MSKLKYTLIVKGADADLTRVRHTLNYLVPIVREGYDNDWDAAEKHQELMQKIAEQKYLNFQKPSEPSSDGFYLRRQKTNEMIPMVNIRAAYGGQHGAGYYEYHLYDVEIVPPLFVQALGEYKFQSVSLRFGSSDIQ